MTLRPLTEAEKRRAKTRYLEDTRKDSDMRDFSTVVCRCNHSVGMHAIVNTLCAGKCGVPNCVCVEYERRIGSNFGDKTKSSSFVSSVELKRLADPTKLCLQIKRTITPCTDIVHEHICEIGYESHARTHVCTCGFVWRGRFKAWEERERQETMQ